MTDIVLKVKRSQCKVDILEYLLKGGALSMHLAKALGYHKSTISHNLRELRKMGLVSFQVPTYKRVTRRDLRNRVYQITFTGRQVWRSLP